MKLTTIGIVPWTEEDIKSKLNKFSKLYKNRPIKDNKGGMKAPHMFASWFIIQYMKFSNIIESGVFYGAGTWFFEQANPNAKIFSIDIKLNKRKYISNKVTYYDKDFCTQNWNDLDKENTLCFFDDHINAFNRTKFIYENNFKYAIFEDNYPIGKGNVVSLKQKFDIDNEDSNYLRSIIKTYYEFPPIMKLKKNRWNEDWNKYPIKDPIIYSVKRNRNLIYKNEADNYTWLCYVEFKNKS